LLEGFKRESGVFEIVLDEEDLHRASNGFAVHDALTFGFPAGFRLGEEGLVFHATTRLGHPGGNSVSPFGIMGGILVGLHSGRVAIDFVENEPIRVVDLLDDVETQVPRLPDGGPGVFESRLDELVAVLFLDAHMNTHGKHFDALPMEGPVGEDRRNNNIAGCPPT